MKLNKKSFISVGALVIVLILSSLLVKFYFKTPDHTPLREEIKASETHALNPDVNLSDAPIEAVTQQNTESSKDGVCHSMRESYANLDEVKKREKIDIRFVNVHKKVDGMVYRLRYFLKDASENEIPTYLVYTENHNDEDILTEKSTYKKGKLYNKIEKAQGEILHTEEAMNIGAEQDLFLHYENKVLKDLQGISPLPGEKDFIECRY